MSEKIICFIPCCNRKTPLGCDQQTPHLWMNDMDATTRAQLLKGREIMKPSIKDSPLTDALSLYDGNFYRQLDKKKIAEKISKGDLRVFIISATYGVVESFEQIYDYDAKMEGDVARLWRDTGLVDVISQIILKDSPNKVFGFFAGGPEWCGGISKYRYFYSEGVKKALAQGLITTEAGCFYRAEGQGVASILSLLRMCFIDAVTSNFSHDFIETVIEKGFRNNHYSKALVKFERFPRDKR